MSPPLFDGPPPPAPFFEGPLYVLGRRRPGPNRWGYDPYSPPLEPLEPLSSPHPLCVKAAEHWLDRATWEARNDSHPELIRRRKRGGRRQRDGARVGRFLEHHTEVKAWKRGDGTSNHHRIMAWALAHASYRDGAVGIWRNGRMNYLPREKFARYVRCPVRVDRTGDGEHRRVRTYQLDRAIDDLIAAGLLMKIPQANHPGILKLTPLAWIVSCVGTWRASLLKKDEKRQRKQKRKAEQLAAAPPPAAGAAHMAAALVGNMAAAAVPDYGPQGPPAGGAQLEEERRRMRDEYPEIRRRPYKPDDDLPPKS